MINSVKAFINNQFRALRAIRGNAKAMLIVEPMFAIPFGLISAYAALYQKALGLSPGQIGFLGTVGSASAVIWSLLGGHITDRVGRRKSLLIADLVGWTMAITLWSIARNFWFFLGAALLNGVGNIAGTAWTCLLVEDSEPEDRMPIFTTLQIITISAGFFVPLAGLAVNRLGLVPASRVLYIIFGISLTSMMYIRNAYTRESRVGEERIKATESHSLLDGLSDYLEATKSLLSNKAALILLAINALLAFRDTLAVTFSNIYINGILRVPADWIALFPTIGSIVQLAVLLFTMGTMDRISERKSLNLGMISSGLSLVLLVIAPARGYPLLIAYTVLGSVGGALLAPALNASWNNSLSDIDRAKLNSVFLLLLSLVRMPAGWAAGMLYGFAPLTPFISAIGLTFLALLAYTVMGKKQTITE